MRLAMYPWIARKKVEGKSPDGPSRRRRHSKANSSGSAPGLKANKSHETSKTIKEDKKTTPVVSVGPVWFYLIAQVPQA